MIQKIVSLPSELQLVTLPWHAEMFLECGIQEESGWSDHRVAAGIAELINRLEYKGVCVEPSFGGRMIHMHALTGRVRPVIGNAGVGAVLAGSWVDRKSGPPGGDAGNLPSASDGIQGAAPDILLPPFADGQVIRPRDHQPMPVVECRHS